MTASERTQKYARENKDKIQKANSERDFKKTYQRQREIIRLDPRNYLLKTARRRALKYGREFSITVKDIIIPKICPVLGFELETLNSGGKAASNSMSLHRIDNSLGYIPGNVAVISFRANALIRDGNLDEFIKIVEYLKT